MILGNRSACATPIRAVAAVSCCSACRMSGRRSSSSEGNPAGTAGGSVCSVSARPRGIRAGFLPSKTLSSSSFYHLPLKSAMRAAALARSASNWSASSLGIRPCRNRAPAIRFVMSWIAAPLFNSPAPPGQTFLHHLDLHSRVAHCPPVHLAPVLQRRPAPGHPARSVTAQVDGLSLSWETLAPRERGFSLVVMFHAIMHRRFSEAAEWRTSQ